MAEITEAQFMAECAKRKIVPYKSNAGTLTRPMFVQGFTFNVVAGGTSIYTVSLSKATEMLGIVVIDGAAGDTAGLIINNDNVFQDASLAAFNPVINIYKETQYYKLPRKLNGNDSVTLKVSGVAAHQIRVIFYLLP
jgi:hypothetical protein